jgi:cytochrome c oxidase cbb3-type subunit III
MMTSGWKWYVVVLVALNIAGCLWLLMANVKRRPGDPSPEDTSHVWDGDITEYNKPLPKWWINLFYITIVFGIGYLAWYGVGRMHGFGHWSSKSEWALDKAAEDARLEETLKLYAGKPIDALAKDPGAVALGRTIFVNNCAACHGSTGLGAKGFPNLADEVWYWGGSPESVLETIRNGRNAVMPAWGTVLTAQGGPLAVDDVVAYVQSLSKPGQSEDEAAERGEKQFSTLCIACHGQGGKGNPILGARDLTTARWLYGGSKAALHQTIAEGRNGVMPAWEPVLGETRVRLVGAYVWTLSKHDTPAPREAAP